MSYWQRIKQWWYKCTHWEFWSFTAIYLPIYPYYFYLALKARSFFFFNAANPSIKNGGFVMESKWQIYGLLSSASSLPPPASNLPPPAFHPQTKLVLHRCSFEQLREQASAFTFPLIVKPDIGGKGRGVALLHSMAELEAYHRQVPVDYLLQAYCDHPMEAGVFYVKDPVTGKGRITGVVEKKFLEVTGDGKQRIRELVEGNNRYSFYRESVKKQLSRDEWEHILPAGQKKILVPVGNHARGATFYDVTKQTAAALLPVIEKTCADIPGFHFGRLDIRFHSWEDFFKGHHFTIIELNGAGSEPTHMYDPTRSIWQAWREIIMHLNLMYRISQNNRKKGARYLGLREGIRQFGELKQYDRKLNGFLFEPAWEELVAGVNNAGLHSYTIQAQ